MTAPLVIDVSHWQTVIDWAPVKAAGVAAVILKATQGSSYVDPTFYSRVMTALDAGLLVGAYHFLDGTSPLAQTKHFLSVTNGLPRLFFDIEPNSIAGNTVTLTGAATAVSDLASLSGRLPGAYIGRYGLDGRGTGLPNGVLARCPLWLPSYGTRPVTPMGWAQWTLWQYTAAGTIPGIVGSVDCNRFAGTPDDLQNWWKS